MDAIDYALSEFERTEPGHSNEIAEARRLLAALREENARLIGWQRYVLSQDFIDDLAGQMETMIAFDNGDFCGYNHKQAENALRAALASARPAFAQEEEAEEARAAARWFLNRFEKYTGKAGDALEKLTMIANGLRMARALLARKPEAQKQEQGEELIELLRTIERKGECQACPLCRSRYGHATDCKLAALLARHEATRDS